MASEAQQLVLVCPQNRLVELDVDIEKDVIKVDDHVFLSVSHDYEKAALLFLRSIADEGRDARVDRLLDHRIYGTRARWDPADLVVSD